jgi:hypothetical protein
MCVRKDHALAGQPVRARRGDFSTLRIQAPNVAVTEVIANDEDNVRLVRRQRWRDENARE